MKGSAFYYRCVIVLAIPGLFLGIISSVKRTRLDTRYNLYRNITYSQGITSVQGIAQIVKKHESLVQNDLLRMIDLRLIEDMFFDQISKQLVGYHSQAHQTHQTTLGSLSGSLGSFGGETENCEYCDSVLTYPR